MFDRPPQIERGHERRADAVGELLGSSPPRGPARLLDEENSAHGQEGGREKGERQKLRWRWRGPVEVSHDGRLDEANARRNWPMPSSANQPRARCGRLVPQEEGTMERQESLS